MTSVQQSAPAAAKVLWVAIIIAVIPWRHVFTHYVLAPGQPWRRSRSA